MFEIFKYHSDSKGNASLSNSLCSIIAIVFAISLNIAMSATVSCCCVRYPVLVSAKNCSRFGRIILKNSLVSRSNSIFTFSSTVAVH